MKKFLKTILLFVLCLTIFPMDFAAADNGTMPRDNFDNPCNPYEGVVIDQLAGGKYAFRLFKIKKNRAAIQELKKRNLYNTYRRNQYNSYRGKYNLIYLSYGVKTVSGFSSGHPFLGYYLINPKALVYKTNGRLRYINTKLLGIRRNKEMANFKLEGNGITGYAYMFVYVPNNIKTFYTFDTLRNSIRSRVWTKYPLI